jgi:DNA polymerase alpha-associated DNA helicase A
MHDSIMRFPSDALYDSQLIAADAVKDRLLTGLPYEVEATEDTKEPLVFWDTQGGDFPEKIEDEGVIGKGGKGMSMGDSKSNEAEAALVKMHVGNLINAGVREEDIAVITPYNAQVRAHFESSCDFQIFSRTAAPIRIGEVGEGSLVMPYRPRETITYEPH